VQWTVDLLLIVAWLGVAFNLKQRVIRPLQTLSNILGALREGDYSIRGRRAISGDALGEVMLEVNELGQTLREQRLGALEATALLRTVMSEIDLAVFAFDADERLRLINRAGVRLLAQPAARLLGRTGKNWAFRCLGRPRTMARRSCEMPFPAMGPLGCATQCFRRAGCRISSWCYRSADAREEERTAWQRSAVLGTS
jgi:PAS domain-containing protein